MATTSTVTVESMDNNNNYNNNNNENNDSSNTNKKWIRGVNLGGWLVLERYITPYQFAITNCHIRGDYCWYPQSLSKPSSLLVLQQQSNTNTNATTKIIVNDCTSTTYINKCHPLRTTPIPNTEDLYDYPVDEWTLGMTFLQSQSQSHEQLSSTDTETSRNNILRDPEKIQIAEEWFNTHFMNFITKNDILLLVNAGVTHIRVPVPHFLIDSDNKIVYDNEPWIVGKRWDAFVQLCKYIVEQKLNIQVWPDLHTSPGSQNGFDNSGQQNIYGWSTCTGWSNNSTNINRTLLSIDTITKAISQNNYTLQVVTGFGLLNEPFKDCNRINYENYIVQAKQIVRSNLGESTSIYVSDMFLASTFNNGHWWLHNNNDIDNDDSDKTTTTTTSVNGASDDNDRPNDPIREQKPNEQQQQQQEENTVASTYNTYHDTYLDSHYYQVFDATTRNFTPAQHIAYTCEINAIDTTSCCYEKDTSLLSILMNNYGQQSLPTNGIRRIIGEWSAAYDTLPVTKLNDIMTSIANIYDTSNTDTNTSSTILLDQYHNRTINNEQQLFLQQYVTAQMVAYESQQVGVSNGWFYWTIKMEFNTFLEWDFLYGISHGWIPNPLPSYNVTSESLYGTCYDILFQTNDTIDAIQQVIHTYPDPSTEGMWGTVITDPVILSHGKSLIDAKDGHIPYYPRSPLSPNPRPWFIRLIFGNAHNSNNKNNNSRVYYDPPSRIGIIGWSTLIVSACVVVIIARLLIHKIRNIYTTRMKRTKYMAIPQVILSNINDESEYTNGLVGSTTTATTMTDTTTTMIGN